MINLSSYCGLVDGKIKASDKNLPVRAENDELLTECESRSSKVYKMKFYDEKV